MEEDSMLRQTILGLLSAGPPMHGFALIEAGSRLLRRRIRTGELYLELERLFCEGLVERFESAPGSRRRRTRYASTPAGREAFETWLAAPLGSVPYPLGLRAALLVGARVELDRGLLEEWQQTRNWERQQLEAELRQIGAAGNHLDPKTALESAGLALVRNVLAHVEADRRLLNDLTTALRSPAPVDGGPGRPEPISRRSGTPPREGSRRAGRRQRQCSSGS
jgi:DNA-binding PadR family transcriptional regulator